MVYANTAEEASFYATRLQTYIQHNKIGYEDISLGMRAPILDRESQAYKVDIFIDVGNLMIMGFE